LGASIESLLRQVRRALPSNARIAVRVGLSQAIHAGFAAGAFDAAIVRRDGGAGDGEVLGEDAVGWRAEQSFQQPDGAPLPLATLAPPCGVRAAAIRALEEAQIPWREAFVSGGCAALAAAALAGLGVAPMGKVASGALPDVGPSLGLPPLPPSQIVLLSRAHSPAAKGATRALVSSIRASLR
jgi:DNA-binding transcriptional LysR family regulator